MATFLLVHGAGQGGWCWTRLAAELEARGHHALAVDLPCEDPAATCATYAETCLDALRGAAGEIIAVGHSLAGLTIPLVAERGGADRLVYLCALLPLPGVSAHEQLEADPAIRPTNHADTLPALRMYHDCPREIARWAIRHLRRQADTPYHEAYPLPSLPAVPSSYVVCDDDRFISPSWSRRAAVDRLGVTPLSLPGGHAPFLSRPRDLAALLTSEAVFGGDWRL